ncbi:MAG: hypothetical protein JXR37_16240 [Kiritimatiellae bacterium]|nr:hypothetical protein [Kiritimatiellia bacterium]
MAIQALDGIRVTKCPYCKAEQTIVTLGRHRCFTCGRSFVVSREADIITRPPGERLPGTLGRTLFLFGALVLIAYGVYRGERLGETWRTALIACGLAGTVLFFVRDSAAARRFAARRRFAVDLLRALLLMGILLLGLLALYSEKI